MHPDLRAFLRRFLGTVFATVFAVAVVTFVAIPFSLGGHPGEPQVVQALLERHLS